MQMNSTLAFWMYKFSINKPIHHHKDASQTAWPEAWIWLKKIKNQMQQTNESAQTNWYKLLETDSGPDRSENVLNLYTPT